MRGNGVLMAVLGLAVAASLVKILGALLYGSRALYVDGLTSIANIVAIVAGVYYAGVSTLPPDSDHPYGHARLGYGAVVVAVAAYSFVAGVASAELLSATAYTVEVGSVYAAAAGTLLYVAVIYAAKKASGFLRAYSAFTWSEVIEGVVVAFSAYMGASYSYVIDYAGALVILGYLFYELQSEIRGLIYELSDTAPPQPMVSLVNKILSSHGLRPRKVRLRMVAPGRVHGDVIVDSGGRLEDVVEKAREARREAAEKGIDLVIMIE